MKFNPYKPLPGEKAHIEKKKRTKRARHSHYSGGIDWPKDGAKFVPKRLRRHYHLQEGRWYRRFEGPQPKEFESRSDKRWATAEDRPDRN